MAWGCLNEKTGSWTHSSSGAVQTRIVKAVAKFSLPRAFQPDPDPTLANFLYPCVAARETHLVHPGVPASLVCRGSLVAHQVLVLLWPPRCQGGLGDPVGLVGCDWSDSHLESDSASDWICSSDLQTERRLVSKKPSREGMRWWNSFLLVPSAIHLYSSPSRTHSN